jgi:hypothetical protein
MQSVSFPARQARSHYRHELRTLTYVTLDEANGGIIRNLNHEGVAVQAVGALRVQQRIRLRFELRFPRLRVEGYGEVSWASPTGQCGIRFVDLPPRTIHQINQWMFSNLLDAIARETTHPGSIFEAPVIPIVRHGYPSEESDGLTLSPTPRPAIRLEPDFSRRDEARVLLLHGKEESADRAYGAGTQLSWLSQPISARTLAWFVDSLVVIAALLLFAVIFLSIAHELPEWPLTLGAALAAAAFVVAAYWTLFAVFGGPSLGVRLAQATSGFEEKEEGDGAARFR